MGKAKALAQEYRKAEKMIEDAGYTVSVASWANVVDNRAYVCSAEAVPNTYGHPRVEVQIHGMITWAIGFDR